MQVLDKGSVELIESWGSDERIIEAARMSTQKGFLGWDNDAKLLAYLYTHKHMTPFEMCGAIFEIKAPIFVFREWHRHRTQSYNEMSGRYSILPNEYYIPSEERFNIIGEQTTNKQAQGISRVTSTYLGFTEEIEKSYSSCRHTYETLLSIGISKELARLVLPVAQYSRMRASANLRNWLQFLTLRMAPNAQWEIRQYANAVHSILSEIFPRTISLFDEESNG